MELRPALLAAARGESSPWMVRAGWDAAPCACKAVPWCSWRRGEHLPLVRTLGWPQPMEEEGEVTPNVPQAPGRETWHPRAHDDYQDIRASCSGSFWDTCSGKDMDWLLKVLSLLVFTDKLGKKRNKLKCLCAAGRCSRVALDVLVDILYSLGNEMKHSTSGYSCQGEDGNSAEAI